MRKLSKSRKDRIKKLIGGAANQMRVAASEFGQYAVEVSQKEFDEIMHCLDTVESEAHKFMKIVDKR